MSLLVDAYCSPHFQQKIINCWGQSGKRWLTNLTTTIAQCARNWQLSEVAAVDNLTWNFVAKARQNASLAVILKISCDQALIKQEYQALTHLQAGCCIDVIAFDEKHHALLIKQAMPGQSLIHASAPQAIAAYSNVLTSLTTLPLPKAIFPSIKDWLTALDQQSTQLPQPLLIKAVSLRNQLLNNMKAVSLLHGDLHHDNILQHQDQYLAIDAKGVIGEKAFEAAAFNFMHDCQQSSQAQDHYQQRCSALANKLNICSQRLSQWVFVRAMLSAAWLIEDQQDPGIAIEFAKIVKRTL